MFVITLNQIATQIADADAFMGTEPIFPFTLPMNNTLEKLLADKSIDSISNATAQCKKGPSTLTYGVCNCVNNFIRS